jgi:hypothetical protein
MRLGYDSELKTVAMPKRQMTLNPKLAAEAKNIVALAFRNDPIEDVGAVLTILCGRGAEDKRKAMGSIWDHRVDRSRASSGIWLRGPSG